MGRARVDVVHFVPALLRAFLDAPGVSLTHRPRLVFTSGEALTPDLVEAWQARFGTPLHNLYGPTEAAVDVTGWVCRPGEGEVPIGAPMDNVTVRVLDARMARVPEGAEGELWLGGVQLATGYAGAPGLTAEAFRPDPFGAPGARLYRTGDRVVRRADGALLYRGRRDGQVKLRGVRIEIGEVEAAVRAHPVVRDAAVRLVDGSLVAWVAPSVPADLASFVAARLPAAMRPGRFVPVAALQLTASGKVDRRALPVPLDTGPAALPRDAVELRIAMLAEAVLGRRPGPEEDLFALGLHSLAAVRLLNLVRLELGVAPGLSAMSGLASVAGLAAAVRRAGGQRDAMVSGPLVEMRRGSGVPVVLVHPVGGDVTCFLRLVPALEGPVYGVQARGLLGGAPVSDLAAMAADYAAEVAARIEGPVRLVGYSMGCAVAFEMARRLGGRVASLVLLDGSAEGAPAVLPSFGDQGSALAAARAAGLVADGIDAAEAARIMDVAAANQLALSAWRPSPFEGAGVLVRSVESAGAGAMGWDRLLQGGVDVHDIDAEHAALLDEAQVAAVARLLHRVWHGTAEAGMAPVS